MNYTLKSFNTGQITLPKKRRDKYSTNHFTAKETKGGLLIKPLTNNDVVYYENEEGFGIYSEEGIDPNEIISKIKSLENG